MGVHAGRPVSYLVLPYRLHRSPPWWCPLYCFHRHQNPCCTHLASHTVVASSMFTYNRVRNACARKVPFPLWLGCPANIQQNKQISTITNAKLWYLKPLDLYRTEKPYHINLPANALGGHAQSNEESQEYGGITITDLRNREKDFTLNKNGFQVFKDIQNGSLSASSTHSASTVLDSTDCDDAEKVRRKVYPAIERWLKDRLEAESVKAFTHDVGHPS